MLEGRLVTGRWREGDALSLSLSSEKGALLQNKRRSQNEVDTCEFFFLRSTDFAPFGHVNTASAVSSPASVFVSRSTRFLFFWSTKEKEKEEKEKASRKSPTGDRRRRGVVGRRPTHTTYHRLQQREKTQESGCLTKQMEKKRPSNLAMFSAALPPLSLPRGLLSSPQD